MSGISLGGLLGGFVWLRHANQTRVELRQPMPTNAGGSIRLPLARGLAVSPSGVHF